MELQVQQLREQLAAAQAAAAPTAGLAGSVQQQDAEGALAVQKVAVLQQELQELQGAHVCTGQLQLGCIQDRWRGLLGPHKSREQSIAVLRPARAV